jgi:hypothetical protein
MEQRPAPIVAGIGGAALVAAVLSVGGHSVQPGIEKKSTDAQVTDKSSTRAEAFASSQEGPWYAFCQEYATTEFDHGEDPAQEWGIRGHHVPAEAEEGTVEITRSIPDPRSRHLETEKFSVKKHMVGDLAGCVPAGAKIRIVIAMVVDPSATQMPSEFDRNIEAIQAAATAQQYNYTRFWFPWRAKESTLNKSADPEAEARRREEPGLLCFRKNDSDAVAANERLFVLLVGETPTSGVNRLQLAHALYYREQFREKNQISDTDQNDLMIAGPHFSASFPAIQDVLDQGLYRKGATPRKASPPRTPKSIKSDPAPDPIPSAMFISPDASGQEFIAEFRQFCNIQIPKCNLHTLSLSSGEARSTALDYLESHGYSQPRIAELSEDESAYGGSELYPMQVTENAAHWVFNDPNPKHVYGLQLHFPRDLSSVRNQSDLASARVAESGSRYFGLPSGILPTQLTVRDPIDSDSPPAFGREQEASQVARSLDDLIQRLRLHRIRAVVITASNPLDRIYLLEYLHDQLPDVRTVTVDGDELELDRPHFVDLTGTLVISTLPSLPGMVNVTRDSPALPPVSFESSRQEGEFLAIETLLDPELDPSNEARQSVDSRRCYAISVVGEDGFLLLANGRQNPAAESPAFPCLTATGTTLASNGSSDLANKTKLLPMYYMTVPESRHGPSYFTTFLWFLGALSAIHFLAIGRSQRHIEGPLSYPHRLNGGLEARRLYLLFVINNQLLLMNFLGVRLSFALLGLRLSSGRTWLTILYILLTLSTVTMTLLLIIFLTQFVKQVSGGDVPPHDRRKLIGYTCVASVYLVWTTWMIWQLPAFQKQSGILLDRITHLNEGVSPVIPITAILLGYTLWSWMQLKRLDWINSRKIDLKLQPAMNEYMYTMVGDVMAEVDALLPSEQAVLSSSVGIIILAAVFLWDSLNGFDGLWFHLWIVIWGFCMLLFTVLTGCFHARSIWNKLQKLLEWLETTPMCAEFEQLGSSGLLSIKIWDLAKFRRSFTVLNQTVESISSLYGANSAEACAAKGELSIFVKADAQGKQVDAGEINAFHDILNVGVESAVRTMETSVQAQKAPPLVDRLGDPITASQHQKELQLYLALRFVALIRYTMLQIGTLIAFVAYGYVVAVLSIMFYAFEGRKTLGDLSLLVFVVLLVWIATIMVQFERNGMLSRLEGSTPGNASYLQVLLHLATVGGLPLLAIVTTQFPAVGNFILLMFRPLLGTLH